MLHLPGDLVSLSAGVSAALRVPLHLRGRRLASMLTLPAHPPSPRAADPELAIVACRWAIRHLSRLPFWKNSCLYRAVGECLVRRRFGETAVLRIGVRSEGDARDIAAHAWVEAAGQRTDRGADDYRRLVPAASPS